jgi:acyl-CoA:acyl-CoA alkyltransferase
MHCTSAFQNVCLESLGYVLPDEIVTSQQIEQRLAPLYQRLRLPPGRLETMTGISERRFWQPHILPSDMSLLSGQRALSAADIDPQQIGALVHGSVCRDHLEPATACRVHHQLGLPGGCLIYDLSNACLGLLNGVWQVANMIELGQIEAGLVVGSEGSRQLVETTIRRLNDDHALTRQSIKPAIASMTIGSASCALLLVHRRLSRTHNRLVGAVARAHSEHHRLCHSGADEAVADGMRPWMATDSERLLQEGIATGVATFRDYLQHLQCRPRDISRTICHQVGQAHRRLLLESLDLPEANDFATYSWLGNTGSAALPISLAIGAEQGFVRRDDQVALLGIGSGINCLMFGVSWQESRVLGGSVEKIRTPRAQAVAGS